MRQALHVSSFARVVAFALVATFGFLGAGSSGAQQQSGNDYCLDEFYGKGGGRAEYSTEGKPAQVSGILEIVMAMSRDGTTGCGYFIRGTEAGAKEENHYTLEFDSDEPKGLMTGTKVTATGKLSGSFLSVSSGSDPSSFKVTSSALAAPAGSVNVNVILVNFLDSTLGATPADIDYMVNTGPSSLSNYYKETSYGKLSVSCTVKGPYLINYNGLGNCNYGTWASAADSAAGVSSGYRMYVLAPSGCGWGGLAYIGGSQSWINGSNWGWQLAYSHEFGHNLGMHHATAGGSEYADHSCTMGNSSLPPHLNAPHHVEMGWMGNGTVTTLSGGTQSYSLTALELSATATQIVQIPKTDTGGYYYVSYRAPIALDATNLESGYLYGTSIHHWSGQGGTWTYLDSVIFDGGTYNDPITGLTVTQSSHDATTVAVTISAGSANQPPVITSGPSVTPNPVDLPNTATVSVTATDSDGPSALTYTWTSSGPGAATFSSNGTTTSDTSTVSFPFAGTYTLTVSVSDGHSSVSGSVGVTVTDPNAVNAPGNLIANVSSRTVTLQWTDNSSNEDGFSMQRAPKVSGNTPGTFTTIAQVGANTTTYTDVLAAGGVYYYRVQAFTNAGRTSPYSNTVKVRVR